MQKEKPEHGEKRKNEGLGKRRSEDAQKRRPRPERKSKRKRKRRKNPQRRRQERGDGGESAKPGKDVKGAVEKGVVETGRAILEMAHGYARSGLIYQATDLYLRVMRKCPSQEGQEAKRRLLEIAQQHELSGRRHLALALYEKVAAFPDPQGSGGEKRASALDEETIPMARGKRQQEAVGGDMAEIPFVDLTEDVDMKQNFDRLGRVQRSQIEIPPAVNSLKKLKG